MIRIRTWTFVASRVNTNTFTESLCTFFLFSVLFYLYTLTNFFFFFFFWGGGGGGGGGEDSSDGREKESTE